jgi:hypothetical protein
MVDIVPPDIFGAEAPLALQSPPPPGIFCRSAPFAVLVGEVSPPPWKRRWSIQAAEAPELADTFMHVYSGR